MKTKNYINSKQPSFIYSKIDNCVKLKVKVNHFFAGYKNMKFKSQQHSYNLYPKFQYSKVLKTDDPLHIFTDFSLVNM